MPRKLSRTHSDEGIAGLKDVLMYLPNTGAFVWTKDVRYGISRGDTAGHKDHTGHIVIRHGRTGYKAHRLAWEFVYGRITDPSLYVDHMNGIPWDNRLANLRLAVPGTNCENIRTAYANNKSCGVLGVYRRKVDGKFTSSIQINGKSRYLGTFTSAEAAHTAYLCAKRSCHPGCTI